MSMRHVVTVRVTVASAVLAVLASGCAASSKAGAPPASPSSNAQAEAAAGYAQPAPAPPPPPPPSAEASPTTPAMPTPSTSTSTSKVPAGGGASSATSRSMALQSASRDVEQSQRELDVAGGDCRNACRALGSMDRAAGRLCELSRGDGEPQRCEDAKQRVYTARDRVRTTCGTCADGTSVDRAAPIPSR